MRENLFLTSFNEQSRLHAIFEDDGNSAWLYLHESNADQSLGATITDCFVYNRNRLISVEEVKSFRGSPPPIAEGYGDDSSICTEPSMYEWNFQWMDHGNSVLLLKNDEPWCLIKDGIKRGLSKSIKQSGPWGFPWDQTLID